MKTAGEMLEALSYSYVVQIFESFTGEWHDYAMFKELGAAESFIKYQQIRGIVTDDYTRCEVFRIDKKRE